MRYGVSNPGGKFQPFRLDDHLNEPAFAGDKETTIQFSTSAEAYAFLHQELRASVEPYEVEIPYGAAHSQEALAFVGESFRDRRSFDNDVYLKPVLWHYELSNGRVLEIVEKTFSNIYRVFPSYEMYAQYRRARLAGE